MTPNTEPATARPCKVLLVEDHPLFRDHLGRLIRRDLGMAIVGECDNIRDAMRMVEEQAPDVAVVDINLRGAGGLELVKDIRARGLSTKVLVLSMHDEELYAERSLRAGARGYVSKNEAPASIIEAIHAVQAGEVFASRKITSRLLDRLTSGGASVEAHGLASLADRELEVFQLLGRGRTTKEIAREIGLGETTVETYRARIKEKLGLASAAEVQAWAARWVQALSAG